jgi:hypothetical protein
MQLLKIESTAHACVGMAHTDASLVFHFDIGMSNFLQNQSLKAHLLEKLKVLDLVVLKPCITKL